MNQPRLLLLAFALASSLCIPAGAASRSFLQTNDIICSIGGANVVSAQEHGYLETFLRVSFPHYNLRFRSLAHEGDTVFAQPRDFNYPVIARQINDVGATVVLAFFGQMEGLDGQENLQKFLSAYEQLLTTMDGRRIVLVSPFTYEHSDPPLPDIAPKNYAMREYVSGIRQLAKKRNATFIDLFTSTKRSTAWGRLTSDGLHLNSVGHWYYDSLIATDLGASLLPSRFLIDPSTGAFKDPKWENVRRSIVSKNQLWTFYYRPTNWAFLGGDRTDQPSSRDYQNPKIRWFPDEMKRFLPLINQAEDEITQFATASVPGPRQ